MKNRILSGKVDIMCHQKFHEFFLNSFYDIDEFINTNKRTEVVDIASLLCRRVMTYLEFVEQNHLRLGNNYFLDYPGCTPGNYFQIPNSSNKIIPQLEFNPSKTKKGGEIYLEKINRVISDFKLGKNKIPSVRVASQEDTGEGIMDSSLR